MNADMEGRAFDEQWSSLPLVLKAQISLLMPVYVIYLFLFGTRETIAENIAVDDLPSSNELLFQDDDFDKLDALLIDERDRRLIGNIVSLREANGKIKRQLALCSEHAHAQRHRFLLHKLKYRIARQSGYSL